MVRDLQHDKTVSVIREESEIARAADVVAVSDAVNRVRTWSRQLHRLYLRECNEPRTEAETAADERKEATLIANVRAELSALGIGFEVNGDPRGEAVQILTPKTRAANNLGGTWAINT